MEQYDLIELAAKGFDTRVAALRPRFKVKKRRTAVDRLKSRMYYRRHKAQIKLWRKRYSSRMRLMHHARKMLNREKPSWLVKHKIVKPHKPTSFQQHLHNLVHGQPSQHHTPSPKVHPLVHKIFSPNKSSK
jgi:hypothetical protein